MLNLSVLDIQKVKELLDLGFTHEQISIMMGGQQEATPVQKTKKSKKEKTIKKVENTTRELRPEELEAILKSFKTFQQRFFFLLGLNTALRVSDIIDLTVAKVTQPRFTVIEKKTKKAKMIEPSQELREIIFQYIKLYNLENAEYLFPSREKNAANYQTDKMNSSEKKNHITRATALNWIKSAAKIAGIQLVNDDGIIGTHTMRKTWAWSAMNQINKSGEKLSIDQISKALNHSNVAVTEHYLGWREKDTAKAHSNITIGI